MNRRVPPERARRAAPGPLRPSPVLVDARFETYAGETAIRTVLLRRPDPASVFEKTAADALAFADDTQLILDPADTMGPGDPDAPPSTREARERLLSEARLSLPFPSGSMLVSRADERVPLGVYRLVMYDFAKVPPVTAPEVDRMIEALLDQAAVDGVQRLAMLPLGVGHGGITPARFVRSLIAHTAPREAPVTKTIVLIGRSRAETAGLQTLVLNTRDRLYH